MAYTTITDPSAYFQTTLYMAMVEAQIMLLMVVIQIYNQILFGLKKDHTSSHALTATNGAGYILSSNNTNAQSSASAFSSFNSDGFTVGSDGKTNEMVKLM
jgi:hypothetical protein